MAISLLKQFSKGYKVLRVRLLLTDHIYAVIAISILYLLITIDSIMSTIWRRHGRLPVEDSLP